MPVTVKRTPRSTALWKGVHGACGGGASESLHSCVRRGIVATYYRVQEAQMGSRMMAPQRLLATHAMLSQTTARHKCRHGASGRSQMSTERANDTATIRGGTQERRH